MDKENLKKITALLVHVAKIDEIYTDKEKGIIKNFIISFPNNEKACEAILKDAEKLESDSNQLLSFTNIIKNDTEEVKFKVIENLWKIIISDKKIDQYESNLMRRVWGLIYFRDKISGEIKLRILEKLK